MLDGPSRCAEVSHVWRWRLFCAEFKMIHASDERFVAWLSELPPRQVLVVRLALNGRWREVAPDVESLFQSSRD
jgi:hypothetical protein